MPPNLIEELIQAGLLIGSLIDKAIAASNATEAERAKMIAQREQTLLDGLVRLAALKPVPLPPTE